MPDPQLRTVKLSAAVKGKPSLLAQVSATGVITTSIHLIVEAEISYQDFLAIAASTEAGLVLVVTPVQQPLPMDDAGSWKMPSG